MHLWGRSEHDPARLAAAPQFGTHPLAAVPPPVRLDRRGIAFVPGLWGNDVLPVCTCVDVGNAARAFAVTLEGYDIPVGSDAVNQLFCATNNCADTPDAIAKQDGAIYIDVLGTARTHGMDYGAQAPLVPGFAVLDGSLSQFAQATATCGAAHIGVRLYGADMDAISAGRTLDTAVVRGDLAGRHMTFTWDFDGLVPESLWRVDAYGVWLPATGRWLLDRVDESYALAFRSLLRPDKSAAYGQMGGFTWH